MQNILLSILSIFVLVSCNKPQLYEKPTSPTSNFSIMESVGDTLLPTDTCYSLRLVSFQATKEIRNPKWIIGGTSYASNSSNIDLIFQTRNEIDIKLMGSLFDNTDTIIEKHLTILNPRDIISPLAGEYLGSNIDSKSDTFRVSINYWFGSRYSWWSNGAYSITNLPNNYKDKTQNFNGFQRPEIKGIIASTGYKNMAFDKSGNILASCIKGYASIKRGFSDTLIINYRILDTSKYYHNGILSYLDKTFIGIKK